jgi:hypothetical protein
MISWIHILAQFTTEILLILAGIIFALICWWTSFWILQKRRYGAIETDIPSGPVKAYLNELIFNAEQLRTQLFGITGSKEGAKFVPPTRPTTSSNNDSSANAALQKQLEILQTKINEQEKQISSLTAEKLPTQEAVTAGSSSSTGTTGADAEAFKKLQIKTSELENRLTEYSILEDDLIHLSKLTKENTQLKALLTEKGISIPMSVPNTPAVVATTTPAETTASPAPATATPAATATPPATATPAEALTPTAARQAETDLVTEFEKLLGQ